MNKGYIRLYSWLYFRYGLNEFTQKEIYNGVKKLGIKTPTNIIVQRLIQKRYIERVSRGIYRVIHPNILLLEALGYKWRDKVDADYRLIIEVVTAKLIEYFREKLVSIILFGSVARGGAREYSDVDLLVIAEDLPEKYSDRVKILVDILDNDLKNIRYRLWIERRKYPLVDVILLNKEEAYTRHPFYLDIIHDAITIYDRDSFMRKRIDELREKLMELGSRRVELPDGRYYWIIKPSIKWGETLEL